MLGVKRVKVWRSLLAPENLDQDAIEGADRQVALRVKYTSSGRRIESGGDARGNAVGLDTHRVGLQVRISACGERACVAEKSLQQSQAYAAVHPDAREAVSEIVQAKVVDAGSGPDPLPGFRQANERPSAPARSGLCRGCPGIGMIAASVARPCSAIAALKIASGGIAAVMMRDQPR
jgi:hypothetical protein